MSARKLSGQPLACVIAALALGACGSSTNKNAAGSTTPTTSPASTPAVAPATTTPTTTTTTKTRAAPVHAKPSRPLAKSHGAPPRTPALPPGRSAPKHHISRAQLAAENAAAIAKAKHAQPLVFTCLSAAGLNHPRAGVNNGVWEGTEGNASPTDANSQVTVSGPYKSDQAAAALAKSLQSIEYTAAGGAFMASAPKTSHLDTAVTKVGVCLAGRAG